MIILSLLLNLVSNSNAADWDCKYHLNDVGVYLENEYLYFGEYLGLKLLDKGYDLAEDVEETALELEMKFETYQKNHFQHVMAKLDVKDRDEKTVTSKSSDSLCLTQICESRLGYKVLRKVIDQVVDTLPVCKPAK